MKIYVYGYIPCTSDLIFFNSGALPNILHYILKGKVQLSCKNYTDA